MMGAIGFLMLVSLSADMMVVIFNNILIDFFGEKSVLLISLFKQISFSLIVFFVFSTVYKVLPDAAVRWKDIFKGTLLSAVLFIIGKYLIGFYLGNSSLGTAYGAAGSLVLLLIWMYYSAMILLFGAEFIEVYARRKNRIIKPSSESVKIITKEIYFNS